MRCGLRDAVACVFHLGPSAVICGQFHFFSPAWIPGVPRVASGATRGSLLYSCKARGARSKTTDTTSRRSTHTAMTNRSSHAR
jgi:hypothetical protein